MTVAQKECFTACKALLAVIKYCTTNPDGHLSIIRVLGNLLTLTTGCQAPHSHGITISNLLCWLPQKVNGKVGREDCKLLPLFPLLSVHRGAEIFAIPASFLQPSTGIPFCGVKGEDLEDLSFISAACGRGSLQCTEGNCLPSLPITVVSQGLPVVSGETNKNLYCYILIWLNQ